MTSAIVEKQCEQTPVSAGEDDVRQYIREIRQFPMLSVEEERDLARRCAQGDQDAIREMVNSNLRLVVSVARDYAGRGVPLLDLIQEGSIGLLAAAKKFDYTRENRFSTYATKWIKQGITRYLTDHAQLIRVPAHTAEKLRKILAAKAELGQETGREPSVEEIALRCDFPAAKVRKYLLMNPETCSLDAPVGDKEAGTLSLLLEDTRSSQPQQEMVRQELKKTMDELLGMLSERHQQVLRLRFGMEDGVCHSLESIGGILGVSKERARQLEKQAMERLQKLGAGLGLEDFLE